MVKALPFIDKPKNKTAVTDVPVNKTLFNMIDNNFINGAIAGRLPGAEYQLKRDEFTASADFAMVLYSYSVKDKEEVVVVTEEDSTEIKTVTDATSSIVTTEISAIRIQMIEIQSAI